MQAVVPRRLSLNIFLLGTLCLPCGTCSLEERGLVEACVVHIGELVHCKKWHFQKNLNITDKDFGFI